MRQIGIIPSGCLGKGNCFLHFSEQRILYASTLAVYVLHPTTFVVQRVLSVQQKAITSISVSPVDANLLAVSGSDGLVCIWKIEEEEIVARIEVNTTCLVAWDPFRIHRCAILKDQGIKLCLWEVFSSVGPTEVLHVRNDALLSTVFRWSPRSDGLLAIGCNAATTLVYRQGQNKPLVLTLADRTTAVVDLQWDRLSLAYLLVAYQFRVVLWDVESAAVLNEFDKQPLEISSLSWMDWTAGNFLTTNVRNHHIKVWNASQKSPIDNARIRVDGGVTSVCMCPGRMRGLMSSVDGGVSVVDIKNMKLEHRSFSGHTETIFACKFSPVSPSIFATGSYDGTIKLWDADTLLLRNTIFCGDVVYCVDWSPNGKILAASTYSGLISLWDAQNGRELARYLNHSKPSFFVAWNMLDEHFLLSSSAEGIVLLLELDLELLQDPSIVLPVAGNSKSLSIAMIKKRFTHKSPVFGIAWNLFAVNVFCSCAQDGNVRIFDISKDDEIPLLVLTGHTARVFSCAWSPLIEGLLATGGDDRSVQVWKISNLQSRDQAKFDSTQLRSHEGYVRALCWNFEHSKLLISGSWDSSIRIWDVASGACLQELNQHLADVYAVASTPLRPCTFISASRDSTIRLWELEGVFLFMRYQAVWNQSLAHLSKHSISKWSADSRANFGPALNSELCGSESSRLESILSSSCPSVVDKFYRIFSFFTGASGYMDVWENVLLHFESDCERSMCSFLRPSSNRRIFHESEVLFLTRTDILQESQKKKNGLRLKEDIRSVTQLALIGDLQRYCETLVDCGKWEMAIACAPSVSIEFWRKLLTDYAVMLEHRGSHDCVPLFVVGQNYSKAVDFCLLANDGDAALLIAKGLESRSSYDVQYFPRSKSLGDGRALINRIARVEAFRLKQKGEIILSGAKLLSVGLVDEAICTFLQNYEFDLAYALCTIFSRDTTECIVRWADRCAQWGGVEFAMQLLFSLPEKKREIEQAMLLRKYCEDSHFEAFFENVSTRSINDWRTHANEEEAIGSDYEAAVGLVICGDFFRAATVCMRCLLTCVKDPWKMGSVVRSMLHVAKKIPASKLSTSIRMNFLCLILWFGAHDAAVAGAFEAASHMLQVLLNHLVEVDFAVSQHLVRLELCIFSILGGRSLGRLILCELSSNNQNTFIQGLWTVISNEKSWISWIEFCSSKSFQQEEEDNGDLFQKIASLIVDLAESSWLPSWRNANIMSPQKTEVEFLLSLILKPACSILMGSNLPVSHQKMKNLTSFFTNEKIKGDVYQGQNFVAGLDEVATWCRFFPFAPTLDGSFIKF